MDRDSLNLWEWAGIWEGYSLWAEAEMLVTLYLHREEFAQELCYVTCDYLVGVVVTCPQTRMETGRELVLLVPSQT